MKGDALEQLRRKREMLRSMSPEQALQLIEFHKDLNFFEALALAKREGKIIVPNDVHDRILIETKKAYIAWTGTIVIYETPDKPFGEKVDFGWAHHHTLRKFPNISLSIAVPEHFMGKKNCALVVEHPDFDLVNLGNGTFELKADEPCIHLLESFPKKSEEYHIFDWRFRIPIGSPIHGSYAKYSKRHLKRSRLCGAVGPRPRLLRQRGGRRPRPHAVRRSRGGLFLITLSYAASF